MRKWIVSRVSASVGKPCQAIFINDTRGELGRLSASSTWVYASPGMCAKCCAWSAIAQHTVCYEEWGDGSGGTALCRCGNSGVKSECPMCPIRFHPSSCLSPTTSAPTPWHSGSSTETGEGHCLTSLSSTNQHLALGGRGVNRNFMLLFFLLLGFFCILL